MLPKLNFNRILCQCFLFCLLFPSSYAEDLQGSDKQLRRAQWHASFKPAQSIGREIRSIEPGSALEEAGLVPGDTLLAINGQSIIDGNTWSDISYSLRAGKKYQILYKRQADVQATTISFDPAPLESYPNLNTEYGFFTSDYNIQQRSIITYPSNASGNLPAIYIVGGLSCSSIEYLPGRKSNFIRSLRYLIQQSGMLVKRIEKPGVGDSSGQCSKTDFHTELNGIEVGLQRLLEDERVDSNRVIVYGSSMGSALAPYLANKYELNGVIADGTFYRSWFEHMLEIERRIQTMNGKSQSEVNDLINRAYIPLYYGMLIEKKTYREVTTQMPFLAEHNYHGAKHMYGRPVDYYHQVQDFDFAGNWASLKAPARIRWGTNDWIMSEYDIDILAEVLESEQHPNFQIYKFPGLDHWDTIHESALNSYQGKPGRWDDRISQQLVDWAQELNRQKN